MCEMNFEYDEDLCANSFYKALQSHHEILLQAAATESWIVCVPRTGYLQKIAAADISSNFVLSHLLVPNNDIGNHYTNLLGQNVIQDGRQLVVVGPRPSSGQQSSRKSAVILFEEFVYRTDANLGLTKLRLWCLDKPIEVVECALATIGSEVAEMTAPIQYFKIESFNDAHKFLDSEFVKSKFVLQRAQKLCHELMAIQRPYTTVDALHKTTKLLLNKIWNLLLSSNYYVKKLVKDDTNYTKILKMAVENYASHYVHRYLLDQIAVLESSQCALMNKKIVNLHWDAQDKNADTRDNAQLVQIVADKLLDIGNRTTVYDKLSLLREILKGIAQRNDPTSSQTSIASTDSRSSDEILEILVDAIICGRSMNWHQNLVLLKRFRFTECDNESSELSYMVTTLEAAQQCILQEKLLNEMQKSEDHLELGAIEIPTFQGRQEFISYLHGKIETKDEATVLEMINIMCSAGTELREKLSVKNLCHPLCHCSKCELKIQAETPLVSTPDSKTGNSCVHLVAKYGLVNALRRILAEDKHDGDADLVAYHRLKNNQRETPLHVASKHGQQNILLLLLHFDQGLNLNLVDMEGNSVLHLASAMGHLNCVKALLYFAEHKQLRALQVNGKNYLGNTSLHLAARAGFCGIVETLLEFSASKTVRNNFGKTPAEVAFCTSIREIIKDDSWDRVAVNHKLNGLEQRLDAAQVELVNKSIERGDVNLALHYLKLPQQEVDGKGPADDDDELEKDLDIIGDLDAEDRVNSCTSEGVYPIHMAMRCNNLFMVKTLVKYNVEFDVKTKEKCETPFHWAVRTVSDDPERAYQALKYVFENVPNLDFILNEQNAEGDTVLHLAIKEGDQRLIKMLVKFSLNFGLVNDEGKDVITLARKLGLTDMADYMEYIRLHAALKEEEVGGVDLRDASSSINTTPETSSTSSQSR